jgi:ABC-2 type transport system ATP-binding protein
MSGGDLLVSARGVTKVFGTTHALRGIDLDLSRGDILGFIGPNGAGKTTTIRILAGLLAPTQGEVTIAGESVVANPRAARHIVGYMPDFVGSYDFTTVREYLHFFAAAHRIPKKQRAAAVDSALELTDLVSKADTEMSHLSRGMGQRASLARCLLHDPALLLLDEPASGLDPRGRIEMRALLRELGKLGKTILISSHILSELSDFCNKVMILEKGRVVASGTPRDVARRAATGETGDGEEVPSVTFRVKVAEREEDALLALRELPAVRDAAVVGEKTLEGTYLGTEEEASIVVETLVKKGLRILAFAEKEVDLEELFLRLTKGDLQ